MKYIIRKGVPLFDRLQLLYQKMKEANAATRDFLSRFGKEVEYYPAPHCLAGGVQSICFPHNPNSELWKRGAGGYIPKKNAKDLQFEFYDLPVVKNNELNSLVGFKNMSWAGKRVWFRPAWTVGDDYHLIDVNSDIDYTPVEGMEEILESEFKALKKAVE